MQRVLAVLWIYMNACVQSINGLVELWVCLIKHASLFWSVQAMLVVLAVWHDL